MAMPDFNELFNDVLEVLSDSKQNHGCAFHVAVFDRKNLIEARRSELMSGGSNHARSKTKKLSKRVLVESR